ncbi:MAG TPA: hypothetical protein VLM38_12220 [Blastocatellia bacterium]|nr:hypothetical protein [Blastocatellia bacterium]
MKRIALIGLMLAFCQTATSEQPAPNIDSLRFLLGKWVGEGTSEVGAGTGYFTFELSLNNKVLVRKNHAEYPATTDRPLVTHDDLMVVYADAAAKRLRAFYTDSEGNVINYTISLSSDSKSVVFLTDANTSGPRFRLTYVVTQPDKMALTFEMASPDKPSEFRKFIDGAVRKVSK